MARPQLWLLSYGLVGLTQAGLVPVLMPLTAARGTDAGLTYSAFSLLGVFAPILGAWADRTGRHRDLLVWGSLGAGCLLLAFDAVAAPLRILLAAGAGLGTVGAGIAGNIIAIQGAPDDEWEDRVALLQRYMSGGQVIGLAAAGLLVHLRPGAGFIFAGAALLVAGVLAAVSVPTAAVPRAETGPLPADTAEPGVALPRRRRPHVSWAELAAFLAVMNPPVRRFLVIWLIAYAAMNGFATLFPVAMTRQFGADPIWPSCAYAIGVGLSLAIYPLAGAATHRRGGERMLAIGFAVRMVVLGALALTAWAPLGAARWLALGGFALIQFVWPVIAVAANSLSVRLAPKARGESVGLFNAATSLASAVGSALAGVVYDASGFAGLSAVACAVVGVGLLLTRLRLRPLLLQLKYARA